MNRVEFIQRLEYLLIDLPENDRLDAIAYYNNYFDEAGEENEEQVLRELGSPEKVAATLKEDVRTSGKPESYDKEKRPKRDFPLALIIILFIFASPLLVAVGGGVVGIIVGVLATLFSIIVAVIVTVFAFAISMLACSIACIVSGAVCIIFGLMRMVANRIEGLVLVGGGCIAFALGILFAILFAWCAFKWLPGLFRLTIDLIRRLFSRGERRRRA